jgi:hypothetical protein
MLFISTSIRADRRCEHPRCSLRCWLHFTRSLGRPSPTSSGLRCAGLGSKRLSTVPTACGTPPRRPCSFKVHPWLASVPFCDTVLP